MGHKDEHHKEKKEHHKEKHHHKEDEKREQHKGKHHHKEDEKKQQMSKEKKPKEEKKAWDVGEKECQAPDYHKMHMCVLKHMGQMQLFDELSENPTHRCSRCGCTSNNRKNLCQPFEL